MKVRANMRGGGRTNRRGRPGVGFFGSPRGAGQGGGGRFGPSFSGGGGGGKIPFDLVFCEDIYPRVQPSQDDQVVAAALLKRNTDLTPSTEELQNVQNLVTRVQGILESLILTPGTFDSCLIDEVRQVGSFKQGTILAGHKTADFVVILKTLPTKESVEALCNKVSEIIQQTECVRTTTNSKGFEISNVQQATIRILITVVPQNFRKLDPELHLEAKVLNEHWQAIRHSRWFEENVSSNSTIKVLIRIMRDIRQRFEAFLPLNTWMLDLLVHFCTMNNPQRSALPVNVAFKRIFSLMSSGIFLPGYSGATGSIPSGRGHYNQHHNYRLLTYEEQDLITATAQTLLRILSHGGLNIILGLEKTDKDIINSPSIWNGVLVVPSEKAYDKPLIGQNEEEEFFEEYIEEENENEENSHEETGEQMDSADHAENTGEDTNATITTP